jgi:hypothetical protein
MVLFGAWVAPIYKSLRGKSKRNDPQNTGQDLQPVYRHGEVRYVGIGHEIPQHNYGYDMKTPTPPYYGYSPVPAPAPAPTNQMTKMKWSQREDVYILRANRLVASLGGDLLAIYLTVLILRKTGHSAFVSEKSTLWQTFLLFAIRPRVAPFTGLLGFWHGWSETGLADVAADALLSAFAGLWVGIHFVRFYWSAPPNPAAPASSLKLLAIGALLTAAPTVGTLGLGVLRALPRQTSYAFGWCQLAWAALEFGIYLVLAALFICSLPFIAVWEICLMIYFLFSSRDRELIPEERTGCLKDPARHPYQWRTEKYPYFYGILVFCSWVINAGNWMFFSIYLNLEEDMYCPTDSLFVTLIWIFVAEAIKTPLVILSKVAK